MRLTCYKLTIGVLGLVLLYDVVVSEGKHNFRVAELYCSYNREQLIGCIP